MFRFLRNLFNKKPESSQADRVDILDLSKWGMGDIPTTGEPPTYRLVDPENPLKVLPGNPKYLPEFYNNQVASEVVCDAPNNRAASITNGYDRDVLFAGPVLHLFVPKGETRTIKGPVFQRVANPFKPGEFTIKGHAPINILRDMAAERTRAILRNEMSDPCAPDHLTVGKLLEMSKFTVVELES